MEGVTFATGELQHTEFLKPSFLDALKWAIRPVLSDQVTYVNLYLLHIYVCFCSSVFVCIYVFALPGLQCFNASWYWPLIFVLNYKTYYYLEIKI